MTTRLLAVCESTAQVFEALRVEAADTPVGRKHHAKLKRRMAAYFRSIKSDFPLAKTAAIYKRHMAKAAKIKEAAAPSELERELTLLYNEWIAGHRVGVEAALGSSIEDSVQDGFKGSLGQWLDRYGIKPPPGGIDKLVPPQVLKWAGKHGGELVTNIDAATVSRMAKTVEGALRDQKTIPELTRQINATFADMPIKRAELVARTETNLAFGYTEDAAAQAVGSTHKEWFQQSDYDCDACGPNEAQGRIPIGEQFQSGDDHNPAHPGCTCSVAYYGATRAKAQEFVDKAPSKTGVGPAMRGKTVKRAAAKKAVKKAKPKAEPAAKAPPSWQNPTDDWTPAGKPLKGVKPINDIKGARAHAKREISDKATYGTSKIKTEAQLAGVDEAQHTAEWVIKELGLKRPDEWKVAPAQGFAGRYKRQARREAYTGRVLDRKTQIWINSDTLGRLDEYSKWALGYADEAPKKIEFWKQTIAKLKDELAGITSATPVPNAELYRQALKGRIKNAEKALRDLKTNMLAGRHDFTRHAVTTAGKEAQNITLHEMAGHQLYYRAENILGREYFTKWGAEWRRLRSTGEIKKISKYAAKNLEEGFAEAATMYFNGERANLPKATREFIEYTIRAVQGATT